MNNYKEQSNNSTILNILLVILKIIGTLAGLASIYTMYILVYAHFIAVDEISASKIQKVQTELDMNKSEVNEILTLKNDKTSMTVQEFSSNDEASSEIKYERTYKDKVENSNEEVYYTKKGNVEIVHRIKESNDYVLTYIRVGDTVVSFNYSENNYDDVLKIAEILITKRII